MFSKLTRVSNHFPQSARDAMSLEVADRLLFYDKLSRGAASSLESLEKHYSCDEASNNNTILDAQFLSHGPLSPGAPSGDHRRNPRHGERNKPGRKIRNCQRPEPSPRTTKSNTTTTEASQANPSLTERGRRAKRHSAPNSAENAQRKAAASATKVRTGSAKTEERNASRHGSPHVKVRRPNSKGGSSTANKSRSSTRKRPTPKSADLYADAGVKALSTSELTVARRSARDSQRQMKQKAKLAIAMWKERMTKKREANPSRSTTCNGCFPPLNAEEVTDLPEKRSPSRTRQPVPRHDCQIQLGSPRQSPRKVTNPYAKPPEALPDEESAPMYPEMIDRDERIESPIPRSSPDELSATDGSTKAASSSQHSAQQLEVGAGSKHNSASSRENQRSKIPRPVDGQGEKVKKNDSAETTSILSSSEKEVTSRENLTAMVARESPNMVLSPSSPLLIVDSAASEGGQDKAQEFMPVQQQRRRRGGHRLLHSTDDEEDPWPDSASTAGSPPIVTARSKHRARHYSRRSPKPVASASPSCLTAGKRSSGGDADAGDADEADSDAQSSAVIVPRRKPYLQRKLVGASSEMRDHVVRKRQRQEVYALNQLMTALEFAQFEHFCRTRNIPLSV